MANLNIEDIKRLREETGAGVMDVKQALEDFAGDFAKAKAELEKKGAAKAAKKSERAANDGLVECYIHAGGKVGSMVLVACETDFVAKTDDFKYLCHELALQVAAGSYETVEELMNDNYMRDESKKVSDVVTATVAKVGENILVKKIARFSVVDM